MNKYIVFGRYSYGNDEMEQFIRENGELIGYVDHNSKKHDKNIKVFDPSIISDYPDAIIAIRSSKVKNIIEYINLQGWKNQIVAYPHLYCQIFPENIDKLAWIKENQSALFDIYEDDPYTHDLLTEVISERSMQEFAFVEPERLLDYPRNPLYFYDDNLAPKNIFTVIDGGAYIGDSILSMEQKFSSRMKRVYAYEPGAETFSQLLGNLCKWNLLNKVVPYNYGIFNENKTLCFDVSGEQSRIIENGSNLINVRTIDSTLGEVTGDLCIKMDVECVELEALEGARNTIKTYNPYMAICVYHKFSDILKIPLKIKSINPDYKFYLRCGVHLECYAVPDHHWN